MYYELHEGALAFSVESVIILVQSESISGILHNIMQVNQIRLLVGQPPPPPPPPFFWIIGGGGGHWSPRFLI